MEPIPRLPLWKRDRRMAKSLVEFRKAHPLSIIGVLVGHTHLLGKGHLADLLGNSPHFPAAREIPLLLPNPSQNRSTTSKQIQKAGTSYFLWDALR
jgi:hypothetical protein